MNIKQENISCIILAGGRGRRFNNQDKGLIELNNKPLIEHVIDAIQPQVDDIVISANRNIDTYNKYSASVIKDGDENFCGPLAGIASAIPFCKHEWILVVPCDMPLLPANLVKQMQKKINDQTVSIVETNERLQLVLFMHSSLLANTQQSLAQQQYKLIDWVKSQNYVAVHFHDDTVFNNINSMEQLSGLN
jgi:molybdopterin-guanine dinucleotide biosynthesis protein A